MSPVKRFSSLFAALVLVVFVAGTGGCTSTPAQNPQNQAMIDHREAMTSVEAAYAASERLAISMRHEGAISLQQERVIVNELKDVVHPLINAARSAMYSKTDEEFIAALQEALSALANVNAKIPPTTQPVGPLGQRPRLRLNSPDTPPPAAVLNQQRSLHAPLRASTQPATRPA